MVRAGLSLEPLPQGCTSGPGPVSCPAAVLRPPLPGRRQRTIQVGGGEGAPGSGSQPRSAELHPGQGALPLSASVSSSARRVGAGVGVVGRCAETPRLPRVGRDPRGGGSRGSCCLASRPSRRPRPRQERRTPVPGLAGIQAPGAAAWPSSLASCAPSAKRVPQHPASWGRTALSAEPWRVRPVPAPSPSQPAPLAAARKPGPQAGRQR